MSDAYGNTASPTGDIGPEAANPNITNEAQNPQEPPMNEVPSLTQEEQADMNALSDAFDRARNAVINASQLAKDVAALREEVSAIRTEAEQQVASLREEVEALRAESSGLRERNAMLDEHLVHARQQRDDAQARVYFLEAECTSLREQRDTARDDLARAGDTIAMQRHRYEDLKREHYHYRETISSLERSRDALRAALDAIKAVFASPAVSQSEDGQPSPEAY